METRPIDLWMLVIELLVLLLIAYEVVVGIRNSIRARKRSRVVEERSDQIQAAILRGQELQKNFPRHGAGQLNVAAWVNEVRDWHQEVQTLLKSYSARTETAFLHDTSGEAPPWWDSVQSSARNEYGMLIRGLNNLRHIMEKPETYF